MFWKWEHKTKQRTWEISTSTSLEKASSYFDLVGNKVGRVQHECANAVFRLFCISFWNCWFNRHYSYITHVYLIIAQRCCSNLYYSTIERFACFVESEALFLFALCLESIVGNHQPLLLNLRLHRVRVREWVRYSVPVLVLDKRRSKGSCYASNEPISGHFRELVELALLRRARAVARVGAESVRGRRLRRARALERVEESLGLTGIMMKITAYSLFFLGYTDYVF